jgi:hypothetical protein
MNKSLIDADFDVSEPLSDDESALTPPQKDSDEKVASPDEDADDGVVVEIEDDAPPEDQGKWVAADDEEDLEEPDDDEVRQYSKSVQKRIKQQTARIHAERRRADLKERDATAAAEAARNLLAEVNRLKDMIEVGEKALVSEHKGNLEASLLAAQRKFREADEADDTDAKMQAMEEISTLAAKKANVEQRTFQPIPRQSLEEFIPPQQAEIQVDDRAAAWQEKNGWFGKDSVMTATAMGVHSDLTQNKGIMPTDDRYYPAIDREMRKRFPEHFGEAPADDQPSRRRRSNVAPARRGDAGGRKKVTLTESQHRLAKRLNLTPEAYAAEMIKLEKEQRNG